MQKLLLLAGIGLAAAAAWSQGEGRVSVAEMKYLGERRVSVTLDGRTATFDLGGTVSIEYDRLNMLVVARGLNNWAKEIPPP